MTEDRLLDHGFWDQHISILGVSSDTNLKGQLTLVLRGQKQLQNTRCMRLTRDPFSDLSFDVTLLLSVLLRQFLLALNIRLKGEALSADHLIRQG